MNKLVDIFLGWLYGGLIAVFLSLGCAILVAVGKKISKIKSQPKSWKYIPLLLFWGVMIGTAASMIDYNRSLKNCPQEPYSVQAKECEWEVKKRTDDEYLIYCIGGITALYLSKLFYIAAKITLKEELNPANQYDDDGSAL